MNRKYLCTLLLVLFTNFAKATVPASIDHSDLEQGQSFTLSIDISKTSEDPKLDVLQQNFNVLSTGSSSQTNIINGHISSEKTFSVSLIPKNPGQQQIPAIKVGNDSTAPITINVINSVNNTSTPTSSQAKKNKIYLDANFTSQNSYVGTPVDFRVKLYFQVPIANVSMQQVIINNAQIQPSGKVLQYEVNKSGVNYHVIEQKFLITPSQAGDIHIPPITVNGITADENQADSMLPFPAQSPFTRVSTAITLHVKQIPDGISPDNWLPAKQVKISESWSVNTSEIKVGQPLTRTISIAAMGIPSSSIPEQNFAVPNNVNAYPDKTNASDLVAEDNASGRKTFKIAYVPTQAGKIEFPATTIKWWNTITNNMESIVIPAKIFNVINNNTLTTVNSQVPMPTNPKPTIAVKNHSSINKWFYIAMILGVFWFITLIVVAFIFKRRSKNVNLDNDTSKTINQSDNKPANEKKALTLVYKACQARDLAKLNLALTHWASIHWERSIYTISDLKKLTDSPRLLHLIDKINLALYREHSFTDFNELEQEIESLVNNKTTNSGQTLKDFYPK